MTTGWRLKTSFAGMRMSKQKINMAYIVVLLTFFIILVLANTTKSEKEESEKISIVDSGDSYDYVIITDNTLKNSFDNLADWKTQKGVKTIIVTVEDITSDPDYNGIDTQEEIRNFIIDAYANWEITYVLLGGDTSIIPFRGVYGIVNEGQPDEEEDFNIPCDLYYAALSGNWDNDGDLIYGEGDSANGGSGTSGEEADLRAEVYIGRAPVDTIIQADNFVNKIIFYERNPQTNYLKNALFLASKLDSSTDGAVTSDNIITNKIPNDFTVTKLYENDGTASNAETTNQLNNGQHIVNIIGHGSSNSLKLANVDYSDTYYFSDVDNLANGNKYFLIYSVGCDSNSFDKDSISEHFINKINDGAFAYLGNSRAGWYVPGEPGNGPSEKLNVELYDAIYKENYFNLGKAFQDSKEDLIGDVEATESMRWCYLSLTLLGDPETPIWTDSPNLLEVSFKSKIYDVQQQFKVYVNDSGTPLQNAVVCLRQFPNLYEVIKTDGNGVATFDINPSSGTIEITVSSHNFLANENTIDVLEMNPPEVEVIFPVMGVYHCNLDIFWNAQDNGTIEDIKIEYKYEDENWQLLIDSLEEIDNPWNWNLLDLYMKNGNYIIKVIAIDDEGNSAENFSEQFVINNPSIKIQEPDGSEILNSDENIEWFVHDDYNEIDNFDLLLSSNGGATYDLLQSFLPSFISSWLWDTTSVEDNENYILKIVANIGIDKIEATSNSFEIYNPDPPVADIMVDKIIVWEDEKIRFDASNSNDPDKDARLEYFWDFDDGNQKNGKILTYSFTKKGFYNVTLTVKDEASLTDNTTIMITVNNALPIAIITVNKTEWIEDDEIFFDAGKSTDNSSDKPTLKYSWGFGDEKSANEKKVIHYYDDEGTYFVNLTVTDDDNEKSQNTTTIIIFNLKPIADAGSYQRANRNEMITFDGSLTSDTISDKPNLIYYWNFGDGTKEDGKNYVHPQHKYSKAGRYNVTLTVVDNNEASDVSRIIIDINNITVQAKISKIDGKEIGKGNQNQEIVFDASDTTKPNDAIIDYFWDFGDGTKGFGKIVRHKYAEGTRGVPYIVTLRIEDNDTAKETDYYYETIMDVYVNWAPEPRIKPFNRNFTVNENITFDAFSSFDLNEYGENGNIVEYLWDFGDGTTGKNETVTHRYEKAGNYIVTLIVKDEEGVSNSTTMLVTIQEERVEEKEESTSSFLEDYLLYVFLIVAVVVIISLIGFYYRMKKKVVFRRVDN